MKGNIIMNWRTLAEHIKHMSEEQQNSDVTLFDSRNEFFAAKTLQYADTEDCDVLDPGHPFLSCL
jgi:hypothetical protein